MKIKTAKEFMDYRLYLAVRGNKAMANYLRGRALLPFGYGIIGIKEAANFKYYIPGGVNGALSLSVLSEVQPMGEEVAPWVEKTPWITLTFNTESDVDRLIEHLLSVRSKMRMAVK